MDKVDYMLEKLNSSIDTRSGKNSMTESISRKEQAAWLAGIFDGEGCIIAYFDCKAKHGKTLDIKVKIVNTDMLMIKKISEILVDEKIRFFYATNGFRNPALEIAVSGQIQSKKFLEFIYPYLVTKKLQALKILELINYRKSIPHRPNNLLVNDQKIINWINEIKIAKHTKINPLICKRRANHVLVIPRDYTSTIFEKDKDIVRAT